VQHRREADTVPGRSSTQDSLLEGFHVVPEVCISMIGQQIIRHVAEPGPWWVQSSQRNSAL
jgi:hypothetical protein